MCNKFGKLGERALFSNKKFMTSDIFLTLLGKKNSIFFIIYLKKSYYMQYSKHAHKKLPSPNEK